MSKWEINYKKEFNMAKFVKSPCDLCVNVETPPRTEQVEGKFGKRLMYIVEDKNLGMIYLSKKQFLIVAQVVGDMTKGNVNVTV